MRDLLGMRDGKKTGFLDGHFLIAMPSMLDPNFSRTVIYVCAHTEDGAMGFVVNRARDVSFPEVLTHLSMAREHELANLPESVRDFPVLGGGPVDAGRGFVLHSEDYSGKDTIPLSEDIYLSATQDIIRAIANGGGPQRAALLLGYAGWRRGQLEEEVAQNAWLSCKAADSLIFDRDLDAKYERAMATMGISASHLSHEAGHA